jgi:hypothetical protein
MRSKNFNHKHDFRFNRFTLGENCDISVHILAEECKDGDFGHFGNPMSYGEWLNKDFTKYTEIEDEYLQIRHQLDLIERKIFLFSNLLSNCRDVARGNNKKISFDPDIYESPGFMKSVRNDKWPENHDSTIFYPSYLTYFLFTVENDSERIISYASWELPSV